MIVTKVRTVYVADSGSVTPQSGDAHTANGGAVWWEVQAGG
jgi:hypothetical protein